jgi:hypothetical protein
MPGASARWPTPKASRSPRRKRSASFLDRDGRATEGGTRSLGKLIQIGSVTSRRTEPPIDQNRLRGAFYCQRKDIGDPRVSIVRLSSLQRADHGAQPYQVILFSLSRAQSLGNAFQMVCMACVRQRQAPGCDKDEFACTKRACGNGFDQVCVQGEKSLLGPVYGIGSFKTVALRVQPASQLDIRLGMADFLDQKKDRINRHSDCLHGFRKTL